MILLSVKRRRKEVRYVSIVTFTAAFFMVVVLLFQDIMNQFMMEQNYQNYGEWVLSASDCELSHPYFSGEGYCASTVSVLSKGDIDTGMRVGMVDESLLGIGRISLYEGRLPEKSNEAAMSPSALSALGYDYELGQEITLRYLNADKNGEPILGEDGEPTVLERSYLLVGTIRGFASVWQVTGLPEIIVTEEELRQYPYYRTIRFYQLDRAYQDIDMLEFIEPFQKKGSVVYNSSVYGNQFWVSSDAFRNMSLVMMVIAVLAIGYLLAGYTSKRRGAYYRYRCMGADKGQIRGMILTECLYATLPAALLGIALAYAAGIAGGRALAAQNNLPDFYVFRIGELLRQTAVIVLVLACAILWTILRTQSGSLAQESNTVTGKDLKRLGRRARKSRKPEKDFFLRYRRLHPLAGSMSAVLSVLCCGLLVMCADKLAYDLRINMSGYQWALQFSMNRDERYVFQWEEEQRSVEQSLRSLCIGMDERELEQLTLIEGVKKIEPYLYDETHTLEWDNMNESPIYEWFRNQYDSADMEFRTQLVFYDTDEIAKKTAGRFHSADEVDWDAWNAGEQVLLVTYLQGADVYAPVLAEDTIRPGDRIRLKSLTEEDLEPVTVQVAGNYTNSIEINSGVEWMNWRKLYTVIGSLRLAEKIAAQTGETPGFNYIQGEFGRLASYEAADKQAAAVAARAGFGYYSPGEAERNLYYQKLVQGIAIYGSLFLLILVIYLVLQKNFTDSRNEYRSGQYRLMKRIGMDNKSYLRMVQSDGIREYLWLAAGIPVGILLRGYLVYQRYSHEFASAPGLSYGCKLLNDMTDSPLWMALDYLAYSIDRVLVILPALALFLVMCWNTVHLTKKYMRSEAD